jgi:hypothetical protein
MGMKIFRASREESCSPMTSDDIISAPIASFTHGVTIAAPVEHVWPWLVQMGSGRGGWYSYDCIDNDGNPSATTILQEFQFIAPGDVFPALPRAKDAFIVTTVEPPRNLVLTVPGKDGSILVTWEFLLQPVGSDTRLLVRGRVSQGWPPLPPGIRPIERIYRLLARLPRPLMIAIGGFGHTVMEVRMLRGIKRRAEARNFSI